jgi:hypothetical protein
MVLLCGRAGRLTAKNGGSRPGQCPLTEETTGLIGAEELASMKARLPFNKCFGRSP